MFFSSACQARINDKVSRRENKWLLLIYNNLLIWKWTYQKRNTTKQRVDKRLFWNNISVLIFLWYETSVLRKITRAKLSGLKCKIVKEFFDWGKLTTVLSVFCWIEIGFGWRTRLLHPEQLWFSFSFGASCCVKNTACCWPTDFNYDFLPPSPFQQSIGLKMCLYMLNKPHSKPRKIVSRNC